MRTLETALWITNLAIVIGCVMLSRKRRRPVSFCTSAAALTAALSIAQIFAEGYRWQMLPVYAASLAAGGMALYHAGTSRKKARKAASDMSGNPRPRLRGFKRLMIALVLCLYVILSAALPSLLPVFTFAEPQGPYKVGTTTMMLEDERREEAATEDRTDRRRLMIQIWYPAEAGTGIGRAPYIEHLPTVLEGLRQSISMPPFLLSQLKYVQPHAMQDAEISRDQERYPVLLFSHGLSGFRNQNTFQVTELASRGYIVVGIDHAYDAAAVVFPDRTAMLKLGNLSGFDAYEDKSRLWVEDAKFVLDELERMSGPAASGFLSGRLDLGKIGMFGHSFGGATAAQMLLADSRVKAALNMDGTLYGQPVPEDGFGKPYMQMNAELSIDRAVFEQSLDRAMASSGRSREDYEQFWAESVERRSRAESGEAHTIVFAHANHMSFTDFYLFSPLLPPKGAEPRQMHSSINALSAAFFDHYVKGDPGASVEKAAHSLPGLIQP